MKEKLNRSGKDRVYIKTQRSKNLNHFLIKKGLISVGGRLQLSNLNFREHHPWILPTKHRYYELLIQRCHEVVLHSGTRDPLIQVRDRFWILKGRQLINQIVGRCPVCKRFKAKPAQQATAPLPRDRVIESPPFETTCVDFAIYYLQLINTEE